jgi:hypothetical protein
MADRTGFLQIDGNVLEGVSATTLWTLHNRATEAKRSDGVIRDPWAVTLLDAISYDYLRFGKPNQWHALRAVAFDAAARRYLTAHPKAAVARDIAAPPARGLFKVNTWPPLDRIGLFRRIRPSLTLLEFAR